MTSFFVKEPAKQSVNVRDIVLVYWDIQNLAPSLPNVAEWDDFIKSEVRRRVPQADRRLFKAFSSPMHQLATNHLDAKGWKVWEDYVDWDDDIYDQAISDAGQSPRRTVVFLITTDGDHVDTVQELRRRGVRVYLIAPPTVSNALTGAVGRKRWIRWP